MDLPVQHDNLITTFDPFPPGRGGGGNQCTANGPKLGQRTGSKIKYEFLKLRWNRKIDGLESGEDSPLPPGSQVVLGSIMFHCLFSQDLSRIPG